MECSYAEELLGAYHLGALEDTERLALEEHLESCPTCSIAFDADGEAVAHLAFSAPQMPVPAGVKHRLMQRIDADAGAAPIGLARSHRWSRLGFPSISRVRIAAAGMATVLVAVASTGLWFNSRIGGLDEGYQAVATQSADLNVQVSDMAKKEAQLAEMLRVRYYFMYQAIEMSAAPGTSISTLRSTSAIENAHGVMMVSGTGAKAMLFTLDLPPLPPDKEYQVWLIRDGLRFDAGTFTVDSTGIGQAVIIPLISLAQFDAIGITVEPSGGSEGPTGTRVLEGGL